MGGETQKWETGLVKPIWETGRLTEKLYQLRLGTGIRNGGGTLEHSLKKRVQKTKVLQKAIGPGLLVVDKNCIKAGEGTKEKEKNPLICLKVWTYARVEEDKR